ncbi:MAG: hypothetical protein JST12_15600 [Armatimonadetes bacterium]|nr:hypothetical protein [Armatimonadota bacterium]
MKTNLLLIIATLTVAWCSYGCGAKPAETTASGVQNTTPEKNELSAKLKSMSPEERARYVQEHPDEIKGTFGGVSGPPAGGQNQR